eukprot:7568712-Pyramimonas_sp.AAC.1
MPSRVRRWVDLFSSKARGLVARIRASHDCSKLVEMRLSCAAKLGGRSCTSGLKRRPSKFHWRAGRVHNGMRHVGGQNM